LTKLLSRSKELFNGLPLFAKQLTKLLKGLQTLVNRLTKLLSPLKELFNGLPLFANQLTKLFSGLQTFVNRLTKLINGPQPLRNGWIGQESGLQNGGNPDQM